MMIRLLPPFAKATEGRPSNPKASEDEENSYTAEPTDIPPILPGNETLHGLAKMAGVETLARVAGESVRPRDTLEELLTRELVAGHAFAMNVLCQANNQFLAVDAQAEDFEHLTKLNQATAQTGMVGVHMMTAVQRGVLLLDRLRHASAITMSSSGPESRLEPPPGVFSAPSPRPLASPHHDRRRQSVTQKLCAGRHQHREVA